METIHQKPRQHVFTIRVWVEALDQEHSEWRGRVEYLSSERQSAYFRSWDSLISFLEEVLSNNESDAHLFKPGDHLPDDQTQP